jgi:hypothetical protein
VQGTRHLMMRYRMNRKRGVRFRTVSLFQKNSTPQRESLDIMQLPGRSNQPVATRRP